MNLAGKTILVTGGAGIGVGAGICQAVQQAGGRLVINDLKQADVDRTVARYEQAVPLAGDVSVDEEVERMFAELDEAGITLDGLVNSAGVGLTTVAYEATAQDYDRLLNIDLRAVWLMSKAFVRHLQKAENTGSIVNISSFIFKLHNRALFNALSGPFSPSPEPLLTQLIVIQPQMFYPK